jgi:nucleoside-diphosphate-sugar epimerase
MIAGALKDLKGWEEDILFSSGVSNSGETNAALFQKEVDLVKQYIGQTGPDSTFVYFSTTSIFDRSKATSLYTNHKIYIENLIKDSDVNYLIIRLPNLVGLSNNPHTLTNFFSQSLLSGRPINLNPGAIRHLIDVADLPSILTDISEKFGKQKVTVNVETDKPLTAEQILNLLEEVVSKKANVNVCPENSKDQNPATPVDKLSQIYVLKTGGDYHLKMFGKYYSG